MVPWRKGTLQIRRSGETPPSGRQWKEAFSFTLRTKKQVHRALYISKGKKICMATGRVRPRQAPEATQERTHKNGSV